MKIKELFPQIELSTMKKPMLRMFLLCLAYNLVYVLIQVFLYTKAGIFQGCVNALSIISSLGLYYFCIKTWEKEYKFEIIHMLYVLGLQSIYVILINFVLFPLYQILSAYYVGYLCMQVICAVLLFIMIPLQLLVYKALSEGKESYKDIKEFIVPLVKDNYQEILNQYLAVMLVVILIDVLLGGQISASGVAASMIDVEQGRINALSVCMNTLYVANPWMMLAIGILAIFIYPVQWIQVSLILVIYIAVGIMLSLLEISYIQYIGRLGIKKKKNGTKKTKTNR